MIAALTFVGVLSLLAAFLGCVIFTAGIVVGRYGMRPPARSRGPMPPAPVPRPPWFADDPDGS